MTKRERVYASIRRQPLDAIPWQFDLTSAVVDRLKLFHKGGYILAPTGAAPGETPAENILAIVEEARAQAK